jgi:hypothetical protein
MNPLLFGLIDKVIGTVANFLDPSKKAEAELALLKLQQDAVFREIDAELAAAKQQTDINLEEAKSGSLFVSGWRPFIGWLFGAAIGWQFILRPAVTTVYIFYTGNTPLELPGLDENLWQLGAGMLGLAGFRTFEKVKGVARK